MKIRFPLHAAFIIVVPAIVSSAESDAKQIMTRSQEATKMDGSESVATLTIFDNKGNKRIRRFSSASKKYPDGVTKMIMRFLEPADVKGTGILTFDNETGDDDMWIYMPALRKTRRIVSAEKTKSFMGSEFSNADITSPNIDDYTYKLLGSENVRDLKCWKIETFPVNGGIAQSSGYSKKIMWVAEKDNMARKTEYYDIDGELLKTLDIRKVKLLDEKNGKYQAIDLTITNVQNNRKSEMKMDTIIFNPTVSDEFFTTRYLEK
ncbi:MAG: outer membrane lipoprotein-sorting protein [Chitinispirillaceae bacterium]|nr:outer membrane lipoprotein-sorting protein [Chitinispirillaceae bacterium]